LKGLSGKVIADQQRIKRYVEAVYGKTDEWRKWLGWWWHSV